MHAIEHPAEAAIPTRVHSQAEIQDRLRLVSAKRSRTFTRYEAKTDMRRLPALMALALGSVGFMAVLYDSDLGDPYAWATFGTSLVFAATCLLVVSLSPKI